MIDLQCKYTDIELNSKIYKGYFPRLGGEGSQVQILSPRQNGFPNPIKRPQIIDFVVFLIFVISK